MDGPTVKEYVPILPVDIVLGRHADEVYVRRVQLLESGLEKYLVVSCRVRKSVTFRNEIGGNAM